MTARRRPAPALRFLLLVVGGWICLRAAMLAPAWWGGEPGTAPVPSMASAAAPPRPGAMTPAGAEGLSTPGPPPPHGFIREFPYKGTPDSTELSEAYRPVAASLPLPSPGLIGPLAAERRVESDPRVAIPDGRSVRALRPQLAARLAPHPAAGPGRWSASAWLLVRDERGGGALAPGGTLGGSQAGGRLLFRVNEGLTLSGRAYLPLRRASQAELAGGIEWRPVAALPVNLLVERRQALGGGGRSAFAVTVHGGVSRALGRGVRLDLYGQAGLVGTRSPDAFVDGSARLAATLGPIEAGAALWGGAQPGAARLDAGPSLAWRLPVRGANLRLQADWRLRLAGEAAPGSGPALTLAADF